MNIINVRALEVLNKYPVNDRLVVINIRSGSKEANLFDDTTMLVFNNMVLGIYESTCDAGTPNLENPVNRDGAAIVMNGFYPKLWKVGKHRGKYEALVQNAPVVVFRDDDRDNILDYSDIMLDDTMRLRLEHNNNDVTIVTASEPILVAKDPKETVKNEVYRIQQGMFGINLHRASQWKELEEVGLYSAGCCVIRRFSDFTKFMKSVDDILTAVGQTTVDALYVTERLINNYNN